MLRFAMLVAMGFAITAAVAADEPVAETTVLKVYSVGNLVSQEAMKANPFGTTTSAEWVNQYPETLEALEELQSIIETMCEPQPAAVRTYRPSLSLVVRHTPSGHEEIEKLLQQLGERAEESIRMTCRPISHEVHSEYNGEAANASEGRSEAEQRRRQALLSKVHLTKSETSELLPLLSAEMTETAYQQTVLLKSGCRTAWGPAGRPCTAMGRINRDDNSVQLRLDFIADDYRESTPIGSQILALREGESGLFAFGSSRQRS